MGQDPGLLRQQLRAEVSHAPAGRQVLGLDGQGLVEERLAQGRAVHLRRRLEAAPHPVDRPEQVDRGGARVRELAAGPLELGGQGRALGLGAPRGEGEAKRGRHPDRRSPPDGHVADGLRHLAGLPAPQEHLLAGQAALVDHHHRSVVPGHGRNHSQPPEASPERPIVSQSPTAGYDVCIDR
jgi:hypothetical protein